MGRRLCTLDRGSLNGRILGYATGPELGYEVQAFDSADDALRGAKECDLLVFREFGENRTRLVREMTKRNPKLDVLVLGGEESPGAMSYHEAGATGFVEPGASIDEVLEHLKANARGETLLDPGTARSLIGGWPTSRASWASASSTPVGARISPLASGRSASFSPAGGRTAGSARPSGSPEGPSSPTSTTSTPS